jgi:hypothetical protein
MGHIHPHKKCVSLLGNSWRWCLCWE